ncbi:MAG TPA: 1-deoxy-D-xylulose-5-phosphate reductoisomerase [bacterium]|nr:1-deoxy-D-xylulose-5-phosphate reductoisomerase [bacterium]
MKKISLWGATGSIGRQTLDVAGRLPFLKVTAMTAHRRIDALFGAAEVHKPRVVAVTGMEPDSNWEKRFHRIGTAVRWGKEGLLELAGSDEPDTAVNGLVGRSGLEATWIALHRGTRVALANKEVLVMAGETIMKAARDHGTAVIPVDSEHSAVFQCLQGEDRGQVRRIVLTASGGPFFGRKSEDLESVTVEEALAHPSWKMGQKVTIDSATLMNKGLEIMEARWLFDLPADRIEVAIHPQSIVHSMVEFADGSIKAQMGRPDMRIPIAYALTWPDHAPFDFERLDFTRAMRMDFYPPDEQTFPALRLARRALAMGGTAPAALNGADEEAVALFLQGKIAFTDIYRLIEAVLDQHQPFENPDMDRILEADNRARNLVRQKADTYKRG